MKIIAANKRANYDYIISNKIEAGIVLTGSEVKSLRINTGSIRGSFIIEKKGELGFSIIPIELYFTKNGLVKLLFGLGKGKKKFDKRESLKEKDWNIKKNRMLKKN